MKRKLWKFGRRGDRVNVPRRLSILDQPGISPRAESVLNTVGVIVIAVLALGWSWTIADAAFSSDGRPSGRQAFVGRSLTGKGIPVSAYVTDALISAFVEPAPGDSVGPFARGGASAGRGGRSGLAMDIARVSSAVSGFVRPLVDFRQFDFVPLEERRDGRIGTYRVGRWPTEGRANVRARYEPPKGFLEVTPENQDMAVSEHFRIADFLTHDQQNVWPKYVVIEPRLIEKLELVIDELQKMGHVVNHVTVMSGFRTPQYNATGGNTGGRAELSRHMYGDAADIFVDNDRNGIMDDLNGNGRPDIGDARVIRDAADRVEQAHPDLIGGVGVYPAAAGHGPFTHIDTRGYRARW